MFIDATDVGDLMAAAGVPTRSDARPRTKSGLLFEQVYCQQAVCAPSRISIMTELRPDMTKVHTLNQPECKEVVDKMEAILQAGPPAALAE